MPEFERGHAGGFPAGPPCWFGPVPAPCGTSEAFFMATVPHLILSDEKLKLQGGCTILKDPVRGYPGALPGITFCSQDAPSVLQFTPPASAGAAGGPQGVVPPHTPVFHPGVME